MTNIRFNAKNEKIKIVFFEMLEHAKGRSSQTIKQFANAINEFENFTNYQSFNTFEIKQAIGFKEYLTSKKNKITGEPISKSYLQNYTKSVREFFEWLSHQKHINYNDVQYFNLTRNDRNKAMATNYQESHEVKDIIATIRLMPSGLAIEKRNKAMISLCLLSTPRISALQSARIGSIKYFKSQDSWAFVHNPNMVNTKFARNITSYFIGDVEDIYQNIFDWIEYLKQKDFKDNSSMWISALNPNFGHTVDSVIISSYGTIPEIKRGRIL